MKYSRIRTAEDALVYFTEVQVTSCEDLVESKSATRSDISREIEILNKMMEQVQNLKGVDKVRCDWKDLEDRLDLLIATCQERYPDYDFKLSWIMHFLRNQR